MSESRARLRQRTSGILQRRELVSLYERLRSHRDCAQMAESGDTEQVGGTSCGEPTSAAVICTRSWLAGNPACVPVTAFMMYALGEKAERMALAADAGGRLQLPIRALLGRAASLSFAVPPQIPKFSVDGWGRVGRVGARLGTNMGLWLPWTGAASRDVLHGEPGLTVPTSPSGARPFLSAATSQRLAKPAAHFSYCIGLSARPIANPHSDQTVPA